MERSLAERHIRLEEATSRHLTTPTRILTDSIAKVWEQGDSAEYIDFGYGVSGDAIARLTRGPK